jgi:hypothetical protein
MNIVFFWTVGAIEQADNLEGCLEKTLSAYGNAFIFKYTSRCAVNYVGQSATTAWNTQCPAGLDDTGGNTCVVPCDR